MPQDSKHYYARGVRALLLSAAGLNLAITPGDSISPEQPPDIVIAACDPGQPAANPLAATVGSGVIAVRQSRCCPACRRVAVIVERADPDRLAPLLMAAYELTDREKDVTRLALQGETTSLHRSETVRLATDRSAASEKHLRQDQRPESAKTDRQGVLRAVRAGRPGRRTPGPSRAAVPRRGSPAGPKLRA